MALILPDGFGLVTIKWSIGAAAHDAQTVLGCANDGTAFARADQIGDAIEANILPELGDAVVFDGVKVIQRDGATYTQGERGSGQNGDVNLAILPPNCSFLVRKLTTGLGRAARGRWYLPGPCESEVTNSGVIDGTRSASLSTALAAFLVAVADLHILHRDPLAPNDYTFAAPTQIYGFAVEPVIATQRRRLR